MIYKLVCVYCVVAVASAIPVSSDKDSSEKDNLSVIPIVSQVDELEPNGTYKFSYETGDGVKREEISYDKTLPAVKGRSATGDDKDDDEESSDEIHVQQGSWSYTAPDGTLIKVSYIADENGFQPVGDHLPRAPVVAGSSGEEKSGRAEKHNNPGKAGRSFKAVADSAHSESKSSPVLLSRSGKPEDSNETSGESSEASTTETSTTESSANENEKTTTENDKSPTENEKTTTENDKSTTENEPSTIESEKSTENVKSTTENEKSTTENGKPTTESAKSATENKKSTTEHENTTTGSKKTTTGSEKTTDNQTTITTTESGPTSSDSIKKSENSSESTEKDLTTKITTVKEPTKESNNSPVTEEVSAADKAPNSKNESTTPKA